MDLDFRDNERSRLKLKTYSHLLGSQRVPTEYEVVTSQLHYYIKRGFEVNVPLKSWYKKNQQDSPLKCKNWEAFHDPRATTYTKYTKLQAGQETFLNTLLQSLEDSKYDRKLSMNWIAQMDSLLTPLCFPFHGFQMISAYIGSMAPSGRLTIAAMLQSADEMKRIQKIVYRTKQLQVTHPDFGKEPRRLWQDEKHWQPLRQAVENLLITYDWGESLIGLNICLKPIVDEYFMAVIPAMQESSDPLLKEFFYSFYEDCKWQRSWTQELVNTVISDTPGSRETILDWARKWIPLAMKAVESVDNLAKTGPGDRIRSVRNFHRDFLAGMNLEVE